LLPPKFTSLCRMKQTESDRSLLLLKSNQK
jgi:hypothetical protein